MNKKQRNIIIMIGTILILIVANFWMKNALLKTDITSSSERQTIYISNYSIGSVKKIEIDNQYGELVLLLENDIWYAQEHEDVKLDQEIISDLTYALTHIVGERTVSENKDTSNLYGMLTPSATITTYHEGVLEQTFVVGKKAPVADEYYLQSSVFNKVYTVDLAYYAYGQIKLEDLMVLNEINIAHADIEKIEITDSLGYVYTIRRTLEDNDISLCYWEFIEPFNHDIDTAVMYGTSDYEGMITYITQLSGESVIGNVQQDSVAYGIDNPIYVASISGESGQYQSFAIGDFGDENDYSLSFSDDSSIYTIAKERVPFIDYSVYVIAESNLDLINIDAVDKVIFDLSELEFTLDINRVEKKKDEGSSAYDTQIKVDKLNEELFNLANINDQKIWFYNDIITIKIDNIIFSYEDMGEKTGSIVYNLNSEIRDTEVIDFYEFTQTHYLAKKNDEATGYIINKREIAKLKEHYEMLLLGQLLID